MLSGFFIVRRYKFYSKVLVLPISVTSKKRRDTGIRNCKRYKSNVRTHNKKAAFELILSVISLEKSRAVICYFFKVDIMLVFANIFSINYAFILNMHVYLVLPSFFRGR